MVCRDVIYQTGTIKSSLKIDVDKGSIFRILRIGTICQRLMVVNKIRQI